MLMLLIFIKTLVLTLFGKISSLPELYLEIIVLSYFLLRKLEISTGKVTCIGFCCCLFFNQRKI